MLKGPGPETWFRPYSIVAMETAGQRPRRPKGQNCISAVAECYAIKAIAAKWWECGRSTTVSQVLQLINSNDGDDRFRLPEGSGTNREFIRGIDMSSVTVELELPQDWKRFQMPVALKARLNSLLDEQDKTEKLSKAEREEAQALTELVDLLSLMKLRAERAGLNKR